MRQVRWASGLVAVAMGVALTGVQPAVGEIASDQAAAIVVYPLVFVDTAGVVTTLFGGSNSSDTVLQIANTSNDPVDLHCFYENANSHCSNTLDVCFAASDCCGAGGCGVCAPGWNETDFRIRLTPQQPLGWLASDGKSDFAIDGLSRVGVGGSSNAGSRIPPVPENPFVGALKCITVDVNGDPIDRNVVKGEATIERTVETTEFDIASYNAVGIPAIPGAVNSDHSLILGGTDGAEYSGCPNVLILNHFFDGADDPITGDTLETSLVLMPCTEDFLRQVPGTAVVQYLVYNEFEQRFSTSRSVTCQSVLPISLIDTTQPGRSIFSAAVSGTLGGQTRLTPIGSGLIGVAVERHGDDTTAAFNLHFQGDRAAADTITLP